MLGSCLRTAYIYTQFKEHSASHKEAQDSVTGWWFGCRITLSPTVSRLWSLSLWSLRLLSLDTQVGSLLPIIFTRGVTWSFCALMLKEKWDTHLPFFIYDTAVLLCGRRAFGPPKDAGSGCKCHLFTPYSYAPDFHLAANLSNEEAALFQSPDGNLVAYSSIHSQISSPHKVGRHFSIALLLLKLQPPDTQDTTRMLYNRTLPIHYMSYNA